MKHIFSATVISSVQHDKYSDCLNFDPLENYENVVFPNLVSEGSNFNQLLRILFGKEFEICKLLSKLLLDDVLHSNAWIS